MKKKLDVQGVMNEMREQSVHFRMAKEKATPPPSRPSNRKGKRASHKVTDLQTSKVSKFESYRLTEFDDYRLPVFSDMWRGEVRLTWEQSAYLDQLEKAISRDRPEGDRSDPEYKRITKNSIIRALVELARRLNVSVDANSFRNERDLLEEVVKAVREKFTVSPSHKVTDLQTSKVPE
jgi:hypothetical protein